MKVSQSEKINDWNSKIPSILLGIFAFLLLFMGQNYLPPNTKSKASFIGPPPLLERFTFGFNETVADSLWIRVVQDLDYCEQTVALNTCKNNSWLYQMIDTITNLSPKFRAPYAVGGLALTVLITDVDGATKIFDKSVKAFPEDWPILFRAAYHYLYEVKNNRHAAYLLLQAADHGAPTWTRTLAGRLYVDSGDLELAQQLLEDMRKTNQDKVLIERLERKIKDMSKQIK